MSALLVLLAVVALLLPAAPFALDYGHHAIHARRHAACLRRIAALEVDLGLASQWHAPQPDNAAAELSEMLERLRYSSRSADASYGRRAQFEKTWEENRKRLARIRYPYDRR